MQRLNTVFKWTSNPLTLFLKMRHTNILIQTLNSMFAANLNNCKDERWETPAMLYIYYIYIIVCL